MELPKFEEIETPTNDKPERMLLASVLEEAITVLRGCGVQANENTLTEAKYYLFESVETGPFSFLWICEELDLNPQAVRKAIRCYTCPEIHQELPFPSLSLS